MISPTALHWRCITASHGGTYTHRPANLSDTLTFNPAALPAIGTHGCNTCVGVYFKLSDTTCFVAHINAGHLDFVTQHDTSQDMRVVTPEEGVYVRKQTIVKLMDESVESRWPEVVEIEEVVIVCPLLRHPEHGALLTGWYIVEGIKIFLERQGVEVNTKAQGFAVEHETGRVSYFPFQDNYEKEEEDEGEEEDGSLSMPNDGVKFVAHYSHQGRDEERWFIDVDEMHRSRERARPRSEWPARRSVDFQTLKQRSLSV